MIETAEKIHKNIEYLVSRGVSHIDALVEYSKTTGVEIETIAEIVKKSSTLKEKIKQEAIVSKLVKTEKPSSNLDKFL